MVRSHGESITSDLSVKRIPFIPIKKMHLEGGSLGFELNVINLILALLFAFSLQKLKSLGNATGVWEEKWLTPE